MELNNNEEDDNLGRNPLINNNNNNNNVNNNNNNENNNDNVINNLINNNQNVDFLSRYSVFSLSFTIIFLVNFIIWIISFYDEFEKYKYLYEIEPIIDHSQYYRFITRYFVHFGFAHLLLELYITLYLCYYFENLFGTLITISFILLAMIIDSAIQLCFYLLLSYISNTFNVIDSSFMEYEGGLTPILFTLNTFFYLFEHDYFNESNMFLFALGNGKYSSITMLIVLYFFTPNRTFMGNLCGIFGAYFMRKIFLCFLPRISWIIEFEWAFGLNKNGSFYRHITSENGIMKQILNQIEPNSLRDMEIEKEEDKNQNIHQINNNDNNENNEAHQSIIEMSSLSNNNNNNINNQNN